jgi:hypothetical protein
MAAAPIDSRVCVTVDGIDLASAPAERKKIDGVESKTPGDV